MNTQVLGVIGGTGLYDLSGMRERQQIRVESPYGEPSADLVMGTIDGIRLAFLARHGEGHTIPPSGINYRANIDVLKRAGASRIISFSAVGSLREEIAPGEFVIADQYIDRTTMRPRSFFDKGYVTHVSMENPNCLALNDTLYIAAERQSIPVRKGGTYLVIEGPQFSTRAESAVYRSWGCAVIGMTAMPEARLAREAELCYATVSLVTDYDCWHPQHASVSTKSIMDMLKANVKNARALLTAAVKEVAQLPVPCPQKCHQALRHAVATETASQQQKYTAMHPWLGAQNPLPPSEDEPSPSEDG